MLATPALRTCIRRVCDGESVEGFSTKDVRELKEESAREGMMGISPMILLVLHRVSHGGRSISRCHTPGCGVCSTGGDQ